MCFREGEIDDVYDSSEHLFMHSGTRAQGINMNKPYECRIPTTSKKWSRDWRGDLITIVSIFLHIITVLDQKKIIVLKLIK